MVEYLLWLTPVAIALVGVMQPHAAAYLFVATLPLFGSAPGGPRLTVACVNALVLGAVALSRGRRPEARYRWTAVAAAVWLIVGLAALAPWPRLPAEGIGDRLRILARLPLLHGYEPLFGWTVIANLALGLLVAWSVLRLIPRSRLRHLAVAASVGVVVTVAVGVLARTGSVDLWSFRPSPRTLDDPRFQSLWVDSRRLAEFLVLAWPLGLIWGGLTWGSLTWGGLIWSPKAARQGRLGHGVRIAFFSLVALGLIWSLQRGAWITVVVQLAALAWVDGARLRHNWRRLAVGAAVVTLLVALTPAIRTPLLQRLQNPTDSSRIHYFQVAGDLLLEQPVLGWGTGSWAFGYESAAPRFGGRIRGADTAHGLPTQIAAERGALGLLAFALLLAALWARTRPEADEDQDKEQLHRIRVATALSGLGFVVYGAFQYLPYLPVLEWLLWILASMWVIATDDSPLARRLAVWGGGGLAAAAVIAIPFQQPRPWQEPPRVGLFAWETSGVRNLGRAAQFAPTHRWTSDHVAVELPKAGEWLSFTLIDGHPRAAEHPATLTIRVDGRLLLERRVPDRWHRCRLRVGDQGGLIFSDGFESGDFSAWSDRNQTPADRALVEIDITPAFRPFRARSARGESTPRSRDVRRLGVVLGNPCDAALCWDDPVSRRRADEAGLIANSGCFPEPPPQRRKGPTPAW